MSKSKPKSTSKPNIETILLPVDGSNVSFKAAEYAIEIAKMVNARIIVIHAIGIPMYITAYGGALLLPSYYEDAKKSAEEWMGRIAESAKQGNIDLKKEVIVDVVSIVDAIIAYAKKQDVDLIVIGTKGRTALKKFLLGSVAHGVVMHAHCPVLVVR